MQGSSCAHALAVSRVPSEALDQSVYLSVVLTSQLTHFTVVMLQMEGLLDLLGSDYDPGSEPILGLPSYKLLVSYSRTFNIQLKVEMGKICLTIWPFRPCLLT
jgi:hypothetical protein